MSIGRDGGSVNDPRDELISALSGGDWDTAELARRAAACARGRVRRRRVLVATGSAIAAAMALAGGMWMGGAREADAMAAGAREARVARIVVEPSRPSVPAALIPGRGQPFELSDDEALELLRGRPLMILPQPDGTRRIVLLDVAEQGGAAPAS